MRSKITTLVLSLILLMSLVAFTACSDTSTGDTGSSGSTSTASYVEATVVGGSGSGYYKVGSTAAFKADTALDGKVFRYWIMGDVAEDNRISVEEEIALVLYEDITLTAFYADEEESVDDIDYVTLSVTGAPGSGAYITGTEVTLFPEMDATAYYDGWYVNDVAVESDEDLKISFKIEADTSAVLGVYSTEIATDADITSSSEHSSYPLANLVDGDLTTKWASNKAIDGIWAQIDLGDIHKVKGFLVYEWLTDDSHEEYRIAEYKIEYSLDGKTWGLCQYANNSVGECLELIFDEAIAARYIKLTYTAHSGGSSSYSNTHMWEFKIIGSEAAVAAEDCKKVYDMSSASFSDAEYYYTGTAQSMSVSGLPSGVTVSYEGNGQTEVGEYEVTATFTGSDEYYAIGSMTATLSIVEGVVNDDGSVNVFANATVVDSSAGGTVGNVIDGDTSTRWIYSGTTADSELYLTLNLNGTYEISSFVFYEWYSDSTNYLAGYRSESYTIWYSTDGENWTSACTGGDMGGDPDQDDAGNTIILDEAITASYIKLTWTTVNDNEYGTSTNMAGSHFWEFEAYTTVD